MQEPTTQAPYPTDQERLAGLIAHYPWSSPLTPTGETALAKLLVAADRFTDALRGRLLAKFAERYTGWDDPALRAKLASALAEDANAVLIHVAHAQPIFPSSAKENTTYLDIAAWALFLWFQQLATLGGAAENPDYDAFLADQAAQFADRDFDPHEYVSPDDVVALDAESRAELKSKG